MSKKEADKPPLSVNTVIPKNKRNGGSSLVNTVTPPNVDNTVTNPSVHAFGIEEENQEETIGSQNLLTELSDALRASITWESNKREDEMTRPHPLKQHLLNTYSDGMKLKDVLFHSYPAFKPMTDGKKVEEYPLSLCLLLLSLSASMVGLPKKYAVNQWDLVANAWSSDLCWKRLQEACKSAVSDFLSSCSTTIDEESKEVISLIDEKTKAEVDLFAKRCKRALTWADKQSHWHNQLCEKLMDKKSNKCPLLSLIFGTNKAPKPSDWDEDTKLFLFSMMTLISDGERKHLGFGIVAQSIAGRPKARLQELKFASVIEEVLQKMEKGLIVPINTPPICSEESNREPPPVLIEDEEATGSSPSQAIDNVSELEAQLTAIKEAENQRHQLALEVMAEQAALPPKERNIKFQQVFHNIGYKVLKEEEKNGVSTLCIGEGQGKCKVDYMHVPRSYKKFSDLGDKQKVNKAKRLKAVIEHQAGSEKYDQQELVLILFKRFFKNLILLTREEYEYSIPELVAMRDHCKFSLCQLDKMIRFDKGLRGKRVRRWPTLYKKNVSAFEKKDAVDSVVSLMPLKMNAKGDEKVCVSSHIKEPWELASHQLESTIIGGHFVPSEKFSNHVNKLIAPVGADKDVAQTSMMHRFANHQTGNSNENVACLAYYEEASESYHNLSQTFLKKGTISREYVQLTMNNCLFVFWVNVTDGAFDGKPIACKCKFLNLFDFCGTADMMFPKVEVNLQEMSDMFCS